MSAFRRQQGIRRQKNRNLISHCPIFVIKIFKKTLKPCSINISNYTSLDIIYKENFFLNPDADYAKMTLRLNSDKVICGVLEDDCRLPVEESSEKERDNIFVFARKRL